METLTKKGYRRRVVVWSVSVVALATAVAAAALPDPILHDWQEEVSLLFGLDPNDVEEGRLEFFLEEDCPLLIGKYGSCFGNNPASPYGMYKFGDYPDPEDAYRWRLAENQAILFIGQTPPDSRYYSFQSYPFSRHRDHLRLEHSQSGACPDAWCCGNMCDHGWFCDEWAPDESCLTERRQLVGAMGLNLNHLELLTDTGDEDSFGKFTVVITTANQDVEQHIRQLLPDRLAELGVSPNIINVETVPCAQPAGDGTCDDADPRNLVLGSELEADDFLMAFRVSITESVSAKEAYLENPPATVLRVTFPELNGFFTPYPWDAVPPAPDENLYNELPYPDALQWLAQRIRDTYLPGGAILKFRLGGRDYYDCLREELTCFAASEDAYYCKSLDIPKACPQEGHSVFVVGVNHSQVGPYSYFGLSIRDSDDRHEIAFFQDIPYVIPNYPDEPPPMEEAIPPYLQGSVEYFLPRAQHPRPDALEGKLSKLYVAEISPSCDPATNPHCLPFLPTDLAGENLGFQERIYLNTVVGTGAWSENFLLSRVIVSQLCNACIENDPSGDTDNDGVCDINDICPGFDDHLDRDGDAVPNGCDLLPGCNDHADLSGDAAINLPDVGMIAEDYGCTAACTGDINGDGATNLIDLELVVTDWLCGTGL